MLLTSDLASCRAALRNGLDPTQVVAHQGWRRARREVLERIASKAGPIAVLGEAGTGKTALLHHLTSLLEQVGYQALLTDRGDVKLDFSEDEIVLLDEADKLAKPVLVRLLQQAPACVCAGLPSFAQSLDGSDLDISLVELAPLSPDETRLFIAERLTNAGWPSDYLTEDAMATIVSYSAGVPRIINLLIRSAVLISAGDGADRVTGSHADEAVAIRGEIDSTVAAWAENSAALTEPQVAAAEHHLDNPPAACANGLPATEPGGVIGPRGRRGQTAVKIADALNGEDQKSSGEGAPETTDEPDAVRSPAVAKSAALPSNLDQLFLPLRQLGEGCKKLSRLPRGVKAAGAALGCVLLIGIWIVPQHPATQSATPRLITAVLPELPAPPEAKVESDESLSRARSEATASISPEADNAGDLGSSSKAQEPIEQGIAQRAFRANSTPLIEPDGSPEKTLPAGAETRVMLTYRRADSRAEATALSLATRLRSGGFLAQPVAVSPGESMGQIVYFFSEDHDAAVDLRKSLAGRYGDPRLVKSSPKSLSTRPGTIEVSVLP
jgi:hypothetical protein